MNNGAQHRDAFDTKHLNHELRSAPLPELRHRHSPFE
jgi:hypothetical protein